MSENFVTDTGRLLWGDLYTPKTTDYDGNPLVIKSGIDAGKPTQRIEFGLAIAKRPGETHYSQSKLGAIIWVEAHKAHPLSAARDDFASKVTDGDSTKPGKPRNGKPGRRPCDKEGYPGHWVFTFGGSFLPKVVNANGSAYILEKDAVQPGDYVQVAGSVAGNTGATPGVYLNHNFVSLQAKGERIISGPDPGTLGFGATPLPAGYAPPTGAMSAPPAPLPPPPAAPAPVPPAAPAPAPVAVQPAPSFIAPPAPGLAPPPAPPAPAAGPVMTKAANGVLYAQFIAAGWNDTTLRNAGYLA
jgi:hypothetical protein